MPYDPTNNPYIPGDPYSYDLRWMVDKIQEWTDPLDSAERAEAAAEAAELSKDAADENALQAEAWAKGTKDGVPVTADDPQYENNSKYWSDQAEDLVQNVEDIQAEVRQDLSDQNDAIDVLEARMDTFTNLAEGSTTGDAELMDARIGYNGLIYPNAGDAIRGQIGDLHTAIDDFASVVYPLNIYDQTDKESGKRLQSNGRTYNTPDYFTTGYIDVHFVGNRTLYLAKNNGDLANFSYVCWYDINHNLLSYSSTVEGSKTNDPSAYYMRFSAVIANFNLDMYINIGSRNSLYTPYFTPYYTTNYDKIVLFGYSNQGSKWPQFSLKSSTVDVLVNGWLTILDKTNARSIAIQTYNSTPQTFSVGSNQALVYDYTNGILDVCALSDLYADTTLYPLIMVNQNGIISGGQWLSYLLHQTTFTYYKEPEIPFSPRRVTVDQDSKAADQSMCVINDWLICWDSDDSDGLVYILNKATRQTIKQMTQNITHGAVLSYDEQSDALMVSDSSGTYIFNSVTGIIESETEFKASDAVYVSGVSLGVFGEIPGKSYAMTRIGAVNTLANYVIKQYTLGMSGTDYDGTYTLDATYTGNYRLGTQQDCKFYDGFFYACFGYQDAVVYRISFMPLRSEFVIEESYNVPDSSTLEAEGIIVTDETIMITARIYNDISSKYYIELNR